MAKTKEQISYNMSRVKNKDSDIELTLRQALYHNATEKSTLLQKKFENAKKSRKSIRLFFMYMNTLFRHFFCRYNIFFAFDGKALIMEQVLFFTHFKQMSEPPNF